MDLFVISSWVGGVLLVALIASAIAVRKLRPTAIATGVFVVPVSLLLASNNNSAHFVQNFFMGIALFGVPLLLHAWLVTFLRGKQGARNAI